ncbi:urease accessory protein UreD [[Phormidium] sp. LEGE 05292]|uniref:urease accessory protein UreD n=1 Tax=[Phormidium] sp. LEGE 05292 TaxID=767427 RepID=UPI002AD324F1|nr:urease accessory protein UreD [Phormidium sp. LEGE 05292]
MNEISSDKIASSLFSEWHGKVNLIYADRQKTTQLIHNLATAPLKVQKPFYPEGTDICHSVILHTAGGMVGGDRLSFDVQLQPNAKALITTAAASKIYRSNGLQAQQNIQIKVDSDAYLEWLTQENIIFNGANYRQDLRVELAPKATWLGWEITRFGRSARGEKFITGEWRSYTEIWREGKPLWIDRQWLPAGEEIINSPHGLAGQPIVASLVWVGEKVSPEIVEKARELWQNQPTFSSKGEAGVTQITEGLLCRYRGASSAEVKHWFKGVWHLLRLCFCDRPSCPPRVWQ